MGRDSDRSDATTETAPETVETADVAVVGGGPAGLAAAEAAAERLRSLPGAPFRIIVFDAKPSLGRKLLMAGKSGLNITHSEPPEPFLSRYRDVQPALLRALQRFGPAETRAWMEGLGQPHFVGSSGRVFPKAMKASPLLRAWLSRLVGLGVELRPRWRWMGLTDGRHRFETPEGRRLISAPVSVLALGGGSWARLGSDGGWTAPLAALGAEIEPFRPSNIGWSAAWSAHFAERFAGAPLKPVRLHAGAASCKGELTVTSAGLEGGPLYTLTPELLQGAEARLDLAPDRSHEALCAALAKPRGKKSFSAWMRKAARLDPVKIALLREPLGAPPSEAPAELAALIKTAPLRLSAPRPMDEAISTAGGLAWSALSDELELSCAANVFAAGEMLAWDAPTGGYLLTACLATGRMAGSAAAGRLSAVRL